MDLKVLAAAAALWLVCGGIARAELVGPKYKFSCLHYCQTHNYGRPVKYCCRAAHVTLATAHSTSTTLTTTAYSTYTTTNTAYSTYTTTNTAYSTYTTTNTAYSTYTTTNTAYSSYTTTNTAYSSYTTTNTAYSPYTTTTAYSTYTTTAYSTYTTTTAHSTYTTTTTSLTTKTVETLVPVVATPVLYDLHKLSLGLGPLVSGLVPGTLHTTTTPHPLDISHSDVPPKKLGECPPTRTYCPRARPHPNLALCDTDYDCAAVDKCCYDACLKNYVCKTSVVVKRHRRSSDFPRHRYGGGRDPGAAEATKVIMRQDGAPVHVLLDQDNNAVAAAEGDVLTITSFPSDTGSSSVPAGSSTAPVMGDSLLYIVEDENGDVVTDASGNTLTLVRYAEGPTLVIHDTGIKVVTGGHAPVDGAFTGRVRSTLIPNLTVHPGKMYSRETSRHQDNYQSNFYGPVLTGRGKTVTLQRHERLTVVNSDGVTFGIDPPTAAEGTFLWGHASITVVDADKTNTDVMVDGEGNLIVDESGHLITVQDIMGTVTEERNPDHTHQVIVDGRGNTVNLLDVNKNVVRLFDQLGKEVTVAPGDYYLILEHYAPEATVHLTDDEFSVIVDGSGNVLQDKYGYSLLVLPHQERQQRSILDYFLDYGEEDEWSDSGGLVEDVEDMGSGLGEDSEMFGSGEEDTFQSSGDMDMTEDPAQTKYRRRRHAHYLPGRERRSSTDMRGGSGWEEEEEDAEMMMRGSARDQAIEEEDGEMDWSEVLHLQGRQLLTIVTMQKMRRSTREEEEDGTTESVTTNDTEDDVTEGSGQSQHRRRRHTHGEHEHRWKRSLGEEGMSDNHTVPQEGGEMDGSGGDEEEENSGMKGNTAGAEDRRRRGAQSIVPLLLMKRSVPLEPLEGDGMERSADCLAETDCGGTGETSEEPQDRRRRHAVPGASRHSRDAYDSGSNGEDAELEEEVHVTTTEGTTTVVEETTESGQDRRGRRSVQQQHHAGRDYFGNHIPQTMFFLLEIMNNFGLEAINMANDIASMNEVLLASPSAIAEEMTSYLNVRAKDPRNFMFMLAYSVEGMINKVIEVLQTTDIGFREEADGPEFDVVLTALVEGVLGLLEAALDVASHIRHMNSDSNQRLLYI